MSDRHQHSAAVDKHGRVINYLRLSITDLCNLRCHYCMPDGVINKLAHDEVLRIEEHLEVVSAAAKVGIDKVRVTGGEPLIKRGVVRLVFDVAQIPGIREVVMTTNGQRLLEMAEPLRAAGLQRFNVSLDSLDPEVYREITRGGDLDLTLRGIDRALELGFPVKINVVLLRGTNTDNLKSFIHFASERGLGLRFIERMGFDTKQPLFSQDEAIEQLSASFDLEPLERNPDHPHVRGYRCGDVKVGFISPMTHSFCGGCNKLRLQPNGSLRLCLASQEAVDMRAILRRPHTQQDVIEAIREAIARKPAAAPWNAPGEMWRVGG